MQRLSYRLSGITPHELSRLAGERFAQTGVALRRLRPADLTRVIIGAEVTLTIVFAATAATFLWKALESPAWAAVSPPGQVSAQPRRTALPAILTDVDPFHRVVGSAPAGTLAASRAPETMLNLQLFGIRAGLDGAPGSAIVGTPDNQQGVYHVGQEIMAGVRLEQVLPNRVVIRRNGVTESLSFERDSVVQQAATPKESVIQNPAAGSPAIRIGFDIVRSLATQLRVSSVERGGARSVQIEGAADASLLQQVGLEPGDLLLSVNGTPVSDMSALAALAGNGAQGLTLEIERKGQRKFHRLTIDRM